MGAGGESADGMPPCNAGPEAVPQQSKTRAQTEQGPSPAKRQRTTGSTWTAVPAALCQRMCQQVAHCFQVTPGDRRLLVLPHARVHAFAFEV